MKISELITRCQELQKEHGDHDVDISAIDSHEQDQAPLSDVAVCMDGDDVYGYLLCDHESMIAFTETGTDENGDEE